LQHEFDVNAETRDNYPLLHVAAKEGNEQVIASLPKHSKLFHSVTKVTI